MQARRREPASQRRAASVVSMLRRAATLGLLAAAGGGSAVGSRRLWAATDGMGPTGARDAGDGRDGPWMPGPGTAPAAGGRRALAGRTQRAAPQAAAPALSSLPAPVFSAAELAQIERDATGEEPPGAGYRLVAPDPRVMPPLNFTVPDQPQSHLPVGSRHALSTELWGRLTLGRDRQPAPLAVLVHGAHDICDGWDIAADACAAYAAYDPACRPVPNQAGYAYLAPPLVDAGLHVLSVNVNAQLCVGVDAGSGATTDQGIAFGAAILAHLEQLRHWDRHGGAPAGLGLDGSGRIDFSRVALMGHSRAGEGVRAAQALLTGTVQGRTDWPRTLADVRVVGLLEIAPIDNFTGRGLTPAGAPWLVLVPTCDGDVYDLQGLWPLDRLFARLSPGEAHAMGALILRGGNHRSANRLWAHFRDELACEDGPALSADAAQAVTAEVAARFFREVTRLADRAHEPSLLDPAAALPPALERLARIERSLLPGDPTGRRRRLESVDVRGLPYAANSAVPALPLSHRGENLTATFAPVDTRPGAVHSLPNGITLTLDPGAEAGAFTYLWADAGTGVDLAADARLSFRLGRAAIGRAEQATVPTPLTLQLVGADGALSAPYAVPARLLPLGPGAVVTVDETRHEHLVLTSVSVPTRDLVGLAPGPVRGLRLQLHTAAGTRFALADMLLD